MGLKAKELLAITAVRRETRRERQEHTLPFLILPCLWDFIAIARVLLCPSYKDHHIPILYVPSEPSEMGINMGRKAISELGNGNHFQLHIDFRQSRCSARDVPLFFFFCKNIQETLGSP